MRVREQKRERVGKGRENRVGGKEEVSGEGPEYMREEQKMMVERE